MALWPGLCCRGISQHRVNIEKWVRPLVDNHYRLVVKAPEGNLFKGMRQLNGIYA